MYEIKHKNKIEFGDFQTPIELTEIIVRKLINIGVKPDIIIEPTCGIGNFILSAANNFQSANEIIGIDINYFYLDKLKENCVLVGNSNIKVSQGDFFNLQWSSLINSYQDRILVLGNFPWITNSQQGAIKGKNLPSKTNFQKYEGLDSITGKSNFDISEWMLIKTINGLQDSSGCLAMLCKTSVARKIINYIHKNNLKLTSCSIYNIDTYKYFKASVQSCLLFCDFASDKKKHTCKVFSTIDSEEFYEIGYYQNTLVKDINTFNSVNSLFTKQSSIKWRSGVKHDCSKVMELSRLGKNKFINGFEEVFELEDTYIYPLLKGSKVANNKVDSTPKFVLVTQKNIGEDTNDIQKLAPRTWSYLLKYSQYLDARKSKIYHNKPQFSMFGVGEYSFKPWKIAICGLYKKLDFKLVGKIDQRHVFFDDTVYFISFDREKEAKTYLKLLKTKQVVDFYSSLIFWDEKRPIKASILNKLDLAKLVNS